MAVISTLRLFRVSRSKARCRRRSPSQKGSTAVELALLAPIFFLLLMGTVELSLIETAQQIMENAAFNTSRLAKTGFSSTGSSQANTVSQAMVTELNSFGTMFDTTKVSMTSTAYNSFASIGAGGTNGMGTATQIVVYTITYPWKLFTPVLGEVIGTRDTNGNWVVNLTSRIVVRNEPYG